MSDETLLKYKEIAPASNDPLNNYFSEYLTKSSVFIDKTALQTKYMPKDIPHRETQTKQLASITAPVLRREKPSNVFIFGKTGTGKTLVTLKILESLKQISEQKQIPIKTIYLNCKMKKLADTEYRVIAHIAREAGALVPATGLPTDEVYNIFLKSIDKPATTIIVLDEIDHLVKKIGDEILYNLTRINSELKSGEICFIGISNDVRFIDTIDPRVKSSLSEEELVFPPYNALELKDILEKRAALTFKPGAVSEGVIEKCAAYAAREHGDARRALDLLRVAGELAERSGKSKIEIKDIDEAESKIERDKVFQIIETLPKQSQLVLYSILKQPKNKTIETGEVYREYRRNSRDASINQLTQRRISDLISELDMLGIINSKLNYKGRYGKTRELELDLPDELISKILEMLKTQIFQM